MHTFLISCESQYAITSSTRQGAEWIAIGHIFLATLSTTPVFQLDDLPRVLIQTHAALQMWRVLNHAPSSPA